METGAAIYKGVKGCFSFASFLNQCDSPNLYQTITDANGEPEFAYIIQVMVQPAANSAPVVMQPARIPFVCGCSVVHDRSVMQYAVRM